MLKFNRESNNAILLAGILALVVGVGVARFVFTSLFCFIEFLVLRFCCCREPIQDGYPRAPRTDGAETRCQRHARKKPGKKCLQVSLLVKLLG